MMVVPSDAFLEDIHRKSSNVIPATLLRSVCRCLFGPVDHDQTKRDLEALSERFLNESNERWDFDFRIGKPAHGGRLDWVPSNAETIEEGSRLDFGPCSDQTRISNNCDRTAASDFNSSRSKTRPYSNPPRAAHVPSNDVTSRLSFPADVTMSRDLDSGVIVSDDLSSDVIGTETDGGATGLRRFGCRYGRTTSRSATTYSGPVRRMKRRTKATRKLVPNLAAQRSAITDYFPKTKASAIGNKVIEPTRQRRRLDNHPQ